MSSVETQGTDGQRYPLFLDDIRDLISYRRSSAVDSGLKHVHGEIRMNTTANNSDSVPGRTGAPSDWSLLLSRMESAPFDSEGREFVERAGRNSTFWKNLDPDQALRCVRVLQQHGLHDLSLEILEWINRNHSESEAAWQEHLETLMLLGRRAEMVGLRARAAEYVPEESLRKWIGTCPPEGREGSCGFLAQDTGPGSAGVEKPFADLRREERNIAAYMDIFSGRHDAFARQWADREQQRQGYVPVRRPMTCDDVKEHLSGRKTYGIYLLEEDSSVRTGVIDIDLAGPFRDPASLRKNRSAVQREAEYLMKRIADMASGSGLDFIAEVSGGKGYHCWFPVSAPVAAGEMRTALQGMVNHLKEDVSCFSLEVFPKQERLTGKGFGNLVKLPLWIHRVTGKKSWLLGAASREIQAQLDYICNFKPSDPEAIRRLAASLSQAEIRVHPRHQEWAREYPELAALETRCSMLGQIFASLRSSRTVTVREEKVLLGTLAHLPRGRALLHHLFSRLPEYNRPLLDYRISRVRGTPLGCRRIHSLLDQSNADLPCTFEGSGYPHPLRHLSEYRESERADQPLSERVANLEDALENLRTALRMVERFL